MLRDADLLVKFGVRSASFSAKERFVLRTVAYEPEELETRRAARKLSFAILSRFVSLKFFYDLWLSAEPVCSISARDTPDLYRACAVNDENWHVLRRQDYVDLYGRWTRQ